MVSNARAADAVARAHGAQRDRVPSDALIVLTVPRGSLGNPRNLKSCGRRWRSCGKPIPVTALVMQETEIGAKASDPSAARREQLRAVIAVLSKSAVPGDRLLEESKAELALLNQQRPPAVRLLALQRRSATLQKKAERILREVQEHRDAIAELQGKIVDAEGELDDVRAQQKCLEAEARDCAVPGESEVPTAVPLHERLGIPKALFARPEVRAKQAEIDAAFLLIEHLRTAAAAASAADEEQRARQTKGAADQLSAEAQDELMGLAFGEPGAATDDADTIERRKRFAERLQAIMAKRPKQSG